MRNLSVFAIQKFGQIVSCGVVGTGLQQHVAVFERNETYAFVAESFYFEHVHHGFGCETYAYRKIIELAVIALIMVRFRVACGFSVRSHGKQHELFPAVFAHANNAALILFYKLAERPAEFKRNVIAIVIAVFIKQRVARNRIFESFIRKPVFVALIAYKIKVIETPILLLSQHKFQEFIFAFAYFFGRGILVGNNVHGIFYVFRPALHQSAVAFHLLRKTLIYLPVYFQKVVGVFLENVRARKKRIHYQSEHNRNRTDCNYYYIAPSSFKHC